MMNSLLLSLLVLPIFWTAHAQDDCSGVCGRRPLATSHASSKRNVGDRRALSGTWPWQMAIIKPVKDRHMHICSGVLLNSLWVVTAAHCFKGRQRWFTSHLRVMGGFTDLRNPGSNAQKRHVRNVTLHKSYNYLGLKNDIAVVELMTPITCTDFIQPACLPDKNVDISSLTHCWITGWSFTSLKMLNIMQEVKVNLIPNQICNSSDWHGGSVRNDHLCAGSGEGRTGACLGDSGGPLSCRESNADQFWVVGIFSAPDDCYQPKKPGIYTSMQFFFDWIKEETKKPTIQPALKPENLVTSYTPRPYQTFKSWRIITTLLILMGNMLVNV